MLKIKSYVKVSTIEEAYELNKVKNNQIIGGMLWLKMQNKNVNVAIDMSDLGLDKIEEDNDNFIIGAMTSLRSLETSEILNIYTNGAMKESLRHIVGVQFRNLATVGGSIFGRYGFSDVLTIFMALDAKVELYEKGIIPISEFAEMKYDRDILVRIIIPKHNIKIAYKSIRNSSTDFPVITCAVSMIDEKINMVIGSRPYKACLLVNDAKLSNEELSEYVNDNIYVESNQRGSADYRKKMSKVLTRRCLEIIRGEA